MSKSPHYINVRHAIVGCMGEPHDDELLGHLPAHRDAISMIHNLLADNTEVTSELWAQLSEHETMELVRALVLHASELMVRLYGTRDNARAEAARLMYALANR